MHPLGPQDASAGLSTAEIDDVVTRALAEDLGAAGDITTAATVPADRHIQATIVARKTGVIAGLDIAAHAFQTVDPAIGARALIADGAAVAPGTWVMELKGPARGILTAERVALNFLGHLSGVATATAEIAHAIAHTTARVCCTRKTTPGLRALEKYAVRCGGGVNHRLGLYDGVLIKDNHIAAAGGISRALKAARKAVDGVIKIEIEVDTLAQLDEVLAIGADVILLDNMDAATLREAVRRVNGRAVTEASGSITKTTAPAIAEAGVDFLSAGWITHSAPCLDLGLDFDNG
ncbi:MAG: carboxylating nicotinate-nucleotide diphosphorylase [Rhodospirillaceae bacterium]|nr:MAG: carboxylating nicotinate-nucleotide diphosphorylase [Rhodospirillaceae bacterium]